MGFTEAVESVLKKNYANFTGRAPRSEYWFFLLFVWIIMIIPAGLMMLTINFETQQVSTMGYVIGALIFVFYLAILIPSLALVVRRLHDRDMSGWWYLGLIVASGISVVNIVASIAFFVLMCLKGTDGDNRFGPDPLRPAGGADIFA